MADSEIAAISAWAVFWPAFLGAFFAFLFGLIVEFLKERKARITAINKALHVLVLNLNRLKNFRQQFLDMYQDRPDRHFSILPAVGCEKFDTTMEVQGLGFMLGGADPSILLKLQTEQDRYDTWLQTLIKRNLLHEQELQPAFQEIGLLEENARLLSNVEKQIGPRLTITMKHLTQQLIEQTNGTITSHEAMIREFRRLGKKHVRFQRFISIADEEANNVQ